MKLTQSSYVAATLWFIVFSLNTTVCVRRPCRSSDAYGDLLYSLQNNLVTIFACIACALYAIAYFLYRRRFTQLKHVSCVVVLYIFTTLDQY